MADVPAIIRQLKGVLEILGYLSPAQDAKDAERIVKGIIAQLHDVPASPKPPSPPAIKPCWSDANRVYEWGLKKLPASRRNYRDIHRAARERADAPDVRIPDNPATFAQHVRAYRRAKGLPLHRQLRRPDST